MFLLRYFHSAYVQYASFKCFAGTQIITFLTLRPQPCNFAGFPGRRRRRTVDVRCLRITQKTGKITGLRRIAPCTPALSFSSSKNSPNSQTYYLDVSPGKSPAYPLPLCRSFQAKQKKQRQPSELEDCLCVKLYFSYTRGRGIRTPIDGFGDRCSAIELFPYIPLHVPSKPHTVNCWIGRHLPFGLHLLWLCGFALPIA